MVGIITKSANRHKLWRRKCHRFVTMVMSDGGLSGSPTEQDYNMCSTGVYAGPPSLPAASLLHGSSEGSYLAHIYLACLWSWSSLKTLHRWTKTGFTSTYLCLLLQYILNTHLAKTGLPQKERENISGRRSDKIQQIQFHSPNLNQQMWSVVINSSLANHDAPWLPSALSFSAENHRNGADLTEMTRGENYGAGKYVRLHTWLICEWTIVQCGIRNAQRRCQNLLMQWIYNKPNYPVEFAYDII